MIETTNEHIDLQRFREDNAKLPPSPYWFPIRMETNKLVRWVPNIVEAIASFKRPIDQQAWETLLRLEKLTAETPEENDLLRSFWNGGGWKTLPQLPYSGKSNPVCRISENALGETLEVIYPSINSAFEHLEDEKAPSYILNFKKQMLGLYPYTLDYIYRPLRAIEKPAQDRREGYLRDKWVLFDTNDRIVGFYHSAKEVGAACGYTARQVTYAHANRYNTLLNGMWVWNIEWGPIPHTPEGNPLPENWRDICI